MNKYRVLTKPGLYIVDAAGLASKDATSDDGSAAEGYEPVRPLRFDASAAAAATKAGRIARFKST